MRNHWIHLEPGRRSAADVRFERDSAAAEAFVAFCTFAVLCALAVPALAIGVN